jgi:hypothetical protein
MRASGENQPKVGAGHLKAMARQGLKEIRGALYAHSNVAQPTEYGMFGTATPGEVDRAIQESARGPEQEPADGKDSVLAERMREAESRGEREVGAKELDRDD